MASKSKRKPTAQTGGQLKRRTLPATPEPIDTTGHACRSCGGDQLAPLGRPRSTTSAGRRTTWQNVHCADCRTAGVVKRVEQLAGVTK